MTLDENGAQETLLLIFGSCRSSDLFQVILINLSAAITLSFDNRRRGFVGVNRNVKLSLLAAFGLTPNNNLF